MALPPLPSEAFLTEEKVQAGGLSLHLRLWGDRTKPLLLLQHGGKDHGRSWDWTVGALMDEYCLAVPDLRGHGDSDWAPGGGYDGFDLAADMAFVVEHLVASGFADPIVVIGHSLGGNIALTYAACQPERVRGVVCIEGLGFSQKSHRELTEKPLVERARASIARRLKVAARPPRVFGDRSEGVKRLAHLHPQLSQEQASHLALHALTKSDGGYRWKHDPLLGAMPLRPLPPSEYAGLHAAITTPVLLLYGAESWASDPSKDGRLEPFQNASFELFEDAGHWLHHDRHEAFIEAVRKFMKELP